MSTQKSMDEVWLNMSAFRADFVPYLLYASFFIILTAIPDSNSFKWWEKDGNRAELTKYAKMI